MQFSDIIKEHIEQLVCPTHDIHPHVEQDWDGIKIICCCIDFHKQCMKQAKRMLDNDKLSA